VFYLSPAASSITFPGLPRAVIESVVVCVGGGVYICLPMVAAGVIPTRALYFSFRITRPFSALIAPRSTFLASRALFYFRERLITQALKAVAVVPLIPIFYKKVRRYLACTLVHCLRVKHVAPSGYCNFILQIAWNPIPTCLP
jgi:hypothetical protein